MMIWAKFKPPSSVLEIYSVYLLLAWTIIIVGILLFGTFQIRNIQYEMAKNEAQANFNKDQALRFWYTKHGGVYVPVTEDTPLNPYLAHVKERDIITPDGKALTLMNPAYMMRQTMEEYETLYGIRGHLTSLKYFRPETAPDEWEKSALQKFKKGTKEVSEFTRIDGKPYYRYMSPMTTKVGCLKCHGHQGYKVGDVRGGVSISVLMTPYLINQRKQTVTLAVSMTILWFLGFLGLVLASRGLKKSIRERDKAEVELQKAHDKLEWKVEERTSAFHDELQERKQIENLLKKSEKKYRSIFENAVEGFFQSTPDGHFISVNHPFVKMFGYASPEELISSILNIEKHFYENAEDRHYYKQLIQQAGFVEHFEFKARCKDGLHIWVSVNARAIYDRNDKIIRYEGSMTDISKRKQAEERLKFERSQLVSIFGSIDESIYVADPNTYEILYVNQTMQDVFQKELVGGICYKELQGLESPCEFCTNNIIMEQNPEPYRWEYHNSSINKDFVIIDQIIKWPDGRDVRLELASDITQRKQMEKELQQANEIVTHSNIVVFNWKNLEGWPVEYVSKNIAELSGYTADELMADKVSYFKIIHPEDQGKVANEVAYFSSMTDSQDINHNPYRIITKDEQIKWISDTTKIIRDKNNKITNYEGIVYDITERKQIQKELFQAKQEADIANQAKSEFLANMSHELRTPLNGIVGFSQVLEDQIFKDLTEKQQNYFYFIKESGEHLLELVNDILDLAKIESGKIEKEMKPFDFGAMLKRSPSIIQTAAHKKNLQVEINIKSELGWFNGDETKIKQVVFNLLSNAMKFTEPGKKIGIAATVEDNSFIVTVWDEGIGISEDSLKKIFDPFEQVKGAEVPKEKGTGLGLAISKRLIELHEGKLSVLSKVGEGSQFIISLPGIISNQEHAPIKNITQQNEINTDLIKDFKILVTEDNEANRELIKAALKKYNLDFAVDGEIAVKMASEKEYNLILMDIQLPGIDGIEAMKQIRKNSKRHTPTMALTAFAMKADEKKYLDEGFDEYISKPLNLGLLKEKIKTFIK